MRYFPAPSIGQVPTTLRSGAISLTTACHAFLEALSTELTFSKTPLCVSIGIHETLRVLGPFAVSTVTWAVITNKSNQIKSTYVTAPDAHNGVASAAPRAHDSGPGIA